MQFVITSLSRKTGKPLWQKTAREQVPHEGHHRDHDFASGSPVTDGEHVFVGKDISLRGHQSLYCIGE